MKARILLLLPLALLFAAPAARADELDTWLSSDSHARAYSAVQGELRAVFQEAKGHGIPASLLVQKLQEGASKGADGRLMVSALRSECDRLEQAIRILAGAKGPSRPPIGPEGRTAAIQSLGFLILTGLPGAVIEDLFTVGSRAGRDFQAVLSAGFAVSDMREAGALKEESCRQLGVLLLQSEIPADAFGSVASIFANAVAGGLSSDEIAQRIIGALRSGGGITAVTAAVSRGASQGQGANAGPASRSSSSAPGASGGGGHPSGGRK